MTHDYNVDPQVSIIMNCFNSATYLEQALQSVLDQTYQNWELIFWDNCSTDESPAIVKAISDSRIKYFRSEQNEVLGQARNHALEKATGEYICFLDCDDFWDKRKLYEQLNVFRNSENIDFIYGNFYSLSSGERKLVYPASKKLPEGHITGSLLVRYRINLQTVMIKREIFDRVEEWFDPSLGLCEEMELFLRMSLVASFSYMHTPFVTYRTHSSQYTVTRFDRFYEEKEQIINKLCNSGIVTEEVFQEEIFSYKTTMSIERSTDLVLRGDRNGARKVLAAFRLKKIKAFIFWILSFSPIGLYLLINDLLGRTFIRERYNFILKQQNAGLIS